MKEKMKAWLFIALAMLMLRSMFKRGARRKS